MVPSSAWTSVLSRPPLPPERRVVNIRLKISQPGHILPAGMNPIYVAYTHEIYANLRPFHATWEPTQSLKLGDVGFLDHRAFRRQTHLNAFEVTFAERSSDARPAIWFGSHGSTELEIKRRESRRWRYQTGSVNLTFNSEGATFFHAADCVSKNIEDQVGLRHSVLELFENGKWDPAWVVITETISASATTIAISGRKGEPWPSTRRDPCQM